jgi:glycosyltransferase involved in cell wall biosynthesis
MVFEQNELLGLRATGIETWILSCRRVNQQALEQTHRFARPLLSVTCYLSYGDAVRGLARAAIRRGGSLLRALGYAARSVTNPLMVPKVMGALILALGWYHRFDDGRPYHVHADFGQNSATAAFFLAMLLGTRFSFKVHAFDIYSVLVRHRDPLRSLKARHAAAIVSEHDYGRRLMERTMPGIGRKIFVNYSAVRTEEFLPLPAPPDTQRFVALGRFVPKKGFDVLVRAAARVRERHTELVVDIFGDGPEEGRLRSLIAEHDLAEVVRLQGPYDNGELPAILQECVALVVPSVVTRTGDMDGVPTVIYEAMALARPVIASAISGIPEVVRCGVTGMLVAPGDHLELAESMSAMLVDSACARRLGQSGRRLIEEQHDYRTAAHALCVGLGLQASCTEPVSDRRQQVRR